MLKKGIGFILAIALILNVTGCAGKASWKKQYDLGEKYLDEGNYEKAIAAFTAAIEIDEKKPTAYLGRARAYDGLGGEADVLLALSDFEKVIELDETAVDAYREAADVYIRTGQYEKAAELLKKAEANTDSAAKELYHNINVTLYRPDEQKDINIGELDSYVNDGWYPEPVVQMYTLDGRTQIVPKAEIEANKRDGWYLPCPLEEQENRVLRAMLYGIGEEPLGEISQLSDTFLAESILEIAKAEYNAYDAADMVPHEYHDGIYTITEQEMQTAMRYMYGRDLKSHIVCRSSIAVGIVSDRDYTCHAPNGRARYGEIKIASVLEDDEAFIVIYSYCRYDTAEHSLERTADSSVDLIARFCRNSNDTYPFQLLSVDAPDGAVTHYTRIYPDTAVKQTILSHYFVDYSPQFFGGTRFKFNDNGTVEIADVSLGTASREYFRLEMGLYSLSDNHDITIKTVDPATHEYTEMYTIRYCSEQNYFYGYEFTQYQEVYSPEPDVYFPVDPNDKGILMRFKVFTYADAPSFEQMEQDFDQKSVMVS